MDETPYTTKTHNRIAIWKNCNKDKDYLYASGTRCWRNKLELQAWLITVHGEVSKSCDNMIEVWYWDDPEIEDVSKRCERQNKVIAKYRSCDGIENSLAIRKIKTGAIKPVEIDI